MSEHPRNESIEERRAPVRRLQISILEVMFLVAALAVSFRWPGFIVPVSLLFLYALAQRRDILRRQARVALGQISLALYLPPVLGLPFVPRSEWGYFLEQFSVLPTFIPAGFIVFNLPWWFRFNSTLFSAAIVVVATLTPLAVISGLGVMARRDMKWWIAGLILAAALTGLMLRWCFASPQNPVAMAVLGTIPTLVVIGGLGTVARQSGTSRIACVILAAAMSAASTFLTWALLHMGA
jgi:hypothetical protein